MHNGTAREDLETREALGTILSVYSIPKLFLLLKKNFPLAYGSKDGQPLREIRRPVGSKKSQAWSVEQLGGLVSCLEKILRYVASFVTQAD